MARLAENFRSRYGVPGRSVAIAFRGRLLYEDAFGMARLRARLVRQSPEQLVARRIAARHAIDSRANFDRLRVSGTRKHASSGDAGHGPGAGQPHMGHDAAGQQLGRAALGLVGGKSTPTCSGRTPTPTRRAGIRRSTGNHCSRRIASGTFSSPWRSSAFFRN